MVSAENGGFGEISVFDEIGVFGWPKVNGNYCNKLSRISMDLGKIEPVFGGSNSISTKLWVWF